MTTKERILETSLSLFADSGYEAVSIRDICKEVGIKESSIYYHFKNKREILDSLLCQFESHIRSLLAVFRSASVSQEQPVSFDWMNDYFFDQYLFDPFCNKLMRLMMIEQFHDERIRESYERWLFIEPCRIETSMFLTLVPLGILSEADAVQLGRDFFANITMLTYKCLLNGELTQEKKEAFCAEAHVCLKPLFDRLGGCWNV